MLILCIILMITSSSALNHSVFTHRKSHDYCYLTKNITIELDYYQIVLLIDNDKYQIRSQMEYAKKCILEHHPTIIIDFQSLYVVSQLLQYPSFGSPRSTTIYIMLYHEKSNLNITKLFDTYSSIWRRSIRPKWLSIYLTDEDKNIWTDEKFQITLLYSWKHKFLDFTIVEMKNYNETTVHSYNPFDNHFRAELFNDNTEIFPDKIHNMHGYPLKTTFLHEPPTLFLEQNEYGIIVNINSTDYWSIEAIAKVMNFTLKILPILTNDYINENKRMSFSEVNNLVLNGTIDFSGNQFYLWGNDSLQRSYVLRPDGQCALVPIRPEGKFKLPKSFYVIIVFITFFVVSLVFVARMMKFNKRLWTCLTLIKVLLGVTITDPPYVLKERILIGCLILISFFYVTDFYAKMTDVKLTTVDTIFKSFDELDKSGLIPLVYPQYYNRTFSAFEEAYQAMSNLKQKSQFWGNPVSCADLLVKKNNTYFCILSERLGHDMMEKFRRNDDKLRLSIMKPCFWITWKGYAFTPASPYVEKFDKILGRVSESGLMAIWAWMVRSPRKIIEDEDEKDEDLKYQLIFILSSGCLLSGCVFFMELAWHKWRLRIKCHWAIINARFQMWVDSFSMWLRSFQ